MAKGGYRGYVKKSLHIMLLSLSIGLLFVYLYTITSDPNIQVLLQVAAGLALTYSAIWGIFGLRDALND